VGRYAPPDPLPMAPASEYRDRVADGRERSSVVTHCDARLYLLRRNSVTFY